MRDLFNFNHLLLSFAILIVFLSICLLLTAWYAIRSKNQLNSFMNNSCWEETLDSYQVYSNNQIVLFGDSQISLWAIAPFFGALPVRNRGVPGDLTSKALARFDRDVVYSGRTSLVVILIGTNDIATNEPPESIIKNIEKMVEKARDNSIAVALCSLLPVNRQHMNIRPLHSLHLINNSLKEISAKYNLSYIDFFPYLLDENGFFKKDYSDDGLHPNFSGYSLMTKILMQCIIPYLKE